MMTELSFWGKTLPLIQQEIWFSNKLTKPAIGVDSLLTRLMIPGLSVLIRLKTNDKQHKTFNDSF